MKDQYLKCRIKVNGSGLKHQLVLNVVNCEGEIYNAFTLFSVFSGFYYVYRFYLLFFFVAWIISASCLYIFFGGAKCCSYY